MGNQNCRPAFYFKELARKRNFKNLTKSLAERCQLKECGNFSDVEEAPQSLPLFSSERNFGTLNLANGETHIEIEIKCFELTTRYPASECI